MRPALDLSPACGAWTGVGRYVRDLARGLAEHGCHAVGVYQGHHGRPDAALAAWVEDQRRYDLVTGRLGLWLRLPGVLRALKADCWHATTTIGVPGARWRGPVVATIHDCYPLHERAAVSAHQRRRFAGLVTGLLARARVVLCPSAVAADEVRAFNWRGPLQVIPHGLPPVDAPPRPALAPAAPYLISLGAIEPRKGLDRLAAAVATLGRAAPPWFHVGPVRHDPDRRLRKAITTAGGRLLGWLPEPERLAWLANAWALAQPSAFEGFGYPPLEAMQLGVPVLARPARALKEQLGAAAWWIAGESPAWAEAIAGLAGDPARHAQLAAVGRSRAARFTLAAMAEAHLAAYAEAMR